MVRLVEGHRKVRQCSTGFPLLHHSFLFPVYYRDLSRIRKIDENSGTFLLKLKRLGVRVEFYVAQFVSAQIKNAKSAAAVAYINLLGGCIKTNVVGVVTVVN